MSNQRATRRPTFAALLRAHRRAAGLTQEELAERAGLSVRTISGLESGAQHTPYKETVRLLAAALALRAEDSAAFAVAASAEPEESASRAPSPSTTPRPLPIPPTALIGRDAEVEAASALLAGETRLLTLLGPAGVGKTRLSLAVASALRPSVEAAYFVDLAPVRDPRHTLSAIARALGVAENGHDDLFALVTARLSDRATLLLLDNFEQILLAAPVVADLLAACAGVRALVTSRAALSLRVERVFPVAPLPAPASGEVPSYEEIAAAPSIQLFVERARQATPDFALTAENARIVAAICRRLDGLPLAIELAAPRVSLLSLSALLQRLEDRFSLLCGGARDLPERQQTLRAALDWSYDLLSAPEQALFRRMSVFVGGALLDAAEALWAGFPLSLRERGTGSEVNPVSGGDEATNPLDLVSALVSKSLLIREHRPNGDARLRLLETLREYGWERLVACGEADEARRTQARHYLRRVEEMERLPYAAFADLRDRTDEEIDNLRAILRWALRASEPADVELGLALAAELGPFWYAAGHISEGVVFLRGLLARVARDSRCRDLRVQAKAHHMSGWLALDQGECGRAVEQLGRAVTLYRQTEDRVGLAGSLNRLGDAALQAGDYSLARRAFSESLELRRSAGDQLAIAGSLNNLGAVALRLREVTEARTCFEEALSLYHRCGDEWGVLFVQSNLGDLAREQGEFAQAERLYEDALTLARARGYEADEAFLLGGLAEVAHSRGDHEQAMQHWSESLAVQRRLGNRYAIATCHLCLGHLARETGRYAEAAAHYGESLTIYQRLSVTKGVRRSVTGLAELARLRGDLELAARLCGVVSALDETLGAGAIGESDPHERTTAAVREALGERRFLIAWQAGRASTREGGAGALSTSALMAEAERLISPLNPLAHEETGSRNRDTPSLAPASPTRSDLPPLPEPLGRDSVEPAPNGVRHSSPSPLGAPWREDRQGRGANPEPGLKRSEEAGG